MYVPLFQFENRLQTAKKNCTFAVGINKYNDNAAMDYVNNIISLPFVHSVWLMLILRPLYPTWLNTKRDPMGPSSALGSEKARQGFTRQGPRLTFQKQVG